jgi:hypothetical protein
VLSFGYSCRKSLSLTLDPENILGKWMKVLNVNLSSDYSLVINAEFHYFSLHSVFINVSAFAVITNK